MEVCGDSFNPGWGNGVFRTKHFQQPGSTQFKTIFPKHSLIIGDDEFVASAPNIKDQVIFVGKRYRLPYTIINKIGLLLTRDGFNLNVEIAGDFRDKGIGIAGSPDGRSAIGHHFMAPEFLNQLAKINDSSSHIFFFKSMYKTTCLLIYSITNC